MTQAQKKLCIIVPFRDRDAHLKEFLPCMDRFLGMQAIPFQMIIAEQADAKPFNRAKLLNVGFDHSKKEFDYFCFHDVDMLPILSDYSFCPYPTHLATHVQQHGWELPYPSFFGGVTLFDRDSFIRVNGYPNEFWGWGGEDDALYRRCNKIKIPLFRKMGKYRSLGHIKDIHKELYQSNLEKMEKFDNSFDGKNFTEGLNTLDYQLKDVIPLGENKICIKVIL